MSAPSNSQLNRAGKILRSWARGDLVDEQRYESALATLLAHRAAHQYPLIKANNGLRSMVRTEQCDVEVTQRLKRVPTIIDKLRREPTMALASMQDIGGCRAVLNSVDEARRVQRRLSRNRPPVRVSDYIAAPRSSGYRGVHVVVQYDDRNVEVQLRTRMMHEWAITVEGLSGRLEADLKGGIGPAPVLALFEAISQAMALEEEGSVVGTDLLDTIESLRREAVPWISGGPR